MKIKSVLFILILSNSFLIQIVFAQGIPDQIIMNPYLNSYNDVGKTLGGASVSLVDSIPDIFHNPANIAWS